MRVVITLGLLSILAGAAGAQPQKGDVVLSFLVPPARVDPQHRDAPVDSIGFLSIRRDEPSRFWYR